MMKTLYKLCDLWLGIMYQKHVGYFLRFTGYIFICSWQRDLSEKFTVSRYHMYL